MAKAAPSLREAVVERPAGMAIPPEPNMRSRNIDDDDDRPRPRRRASAPQSSTNAILLIVGLVVGGLFAVFLLVGLVFWWLFASFHEVQKAPVAKMAAAPMAVDMDMAPMKKPAVLFVPAPAGQGQFKQPAPSLVPTNYLRAVSSEGDSIGLGKKYDYPGNQLLVQRIDRGVQVQVDGWTIEIGAPEGNFLQVGEYSGAKRFPFSENAPGLQFSGQGRACNQIAGRFVVWEIETNINGFTRLAIDFVQHGEIVGPPLTGSLRINSTFE